MEIFCEKFISRFRLPKYMSSYIVGWFCHLRELRTLLRWWVHCWDAAAKRRESLSRWCKLLSRFNAFSRNRVVCLHRLAKTNREMLELSKQKIIFHDIDDHSFMIFTICSCSCMVRQKMHAIVTTKHKNINYHSIGHSNDSKICHQNFRFCAFHETMFERYDFIW